MKGVIAASVLAAVSVTLAAVGIVYEPAHPGPTPRVGISDAVYVTRDGTTLYPAGTVPGPL